MGNFFICFPKHLHAKVVVELKNEVTLPGSYLPCDKLSGSSQKEIMLEASKEDRDKIKGGNKVTIEYFHQSDQGGYFSEFWTMS